MAETIFSPGVLTNENDSSFITQQPIEPGAAIIGPSVKGPVERPTIVTTYSEYVNTFGTTFLSGSQTYSYFTSISAYNYFNSGGTSLLVTRVTSGSFTPATSSIATNNILAIAGATASLEVDASAVGTSSSTGSFYGFGFEIEQNGSTYYYAAAPNTIGFNQINYLGGNQVIALVGVAALATTDQYMDAVVTGLNQLTTQTGVVASYTSPDLLLQATTPGTNLNAVPTKYGNGWGNFITSPSTLGSLSGGTANTGDSSFTLETLSEGIIMNNDSTENSDGSLPSGSSDNVRWQIVSPNTASGTFSLLIRRGDDDSISPSVLETWDNLSLDPLDPNYIEKVIGNQSTSIATDGSDTYLQVSGNYQNQSKYVRVKDVPYKTPNYLDNAGNPVTAFTASIPITGRGVFDGAVGENISSTEGKYYENITDSNTQGLSATDYTQTINLLSNRDEYQFKYITMPGLIKDFASHTSTVNSLVTMCRERGDTMAVVDMLDYNANLSEVVNEASTLNSSYAATYWPWLQTLDPNSGQQVWIPASTMIPSIYAFTDASTEPWFAPAGTTRGALSTIIKAERILTQGNRDTLYQANVNPIATFTSSGISVFGQKTLQKKKSALDRVNVRRLLIELKTNIKQVADELVFEQNTVATRNEFTSQVNPYLASIQQRQGLYSFKVVMDDTNNTSTTIDNNQLIGAIYIQPVKTAEFIILDFNVTSTGVTFE